MFLVLTLAQSKAPVTVNALHIVSLTNQHISNRGLVTEVVLVGGGRFNVIEPQDTIRTMFKEALA